MRANYRYLESKTDKKTSSALSRVNKQKQPKRKGLRFLSCAVTVSMAAIALVVPTTTLAPDVDAYEDTRAASLAVGSLSDFSIVITDNCVEETTAPVTAQPTTEQPTTAKTKQKKQTSAAKSSKTDSSSSASESSKASEPSESEVSASTSSTENAAVTTVDYEESSGSSSSSSTSSSSGSYLVSISNPDPDYTAASLTLSSYDRSKLERLVMGEAGSMGYTGCALVAQAIRDAMVRSNTTSIDRIISEYQYFGSTAYQPNQDVKNAVSFIFDQNGSAVQHRILCFYVGASSWHETQNYITSCGSVRFFDLWY